METKGEAAERILGKTTTYDSALPQSWVDAMASRDFDVRPHFVWVYLDGDIFGYPHPVTPEGTVMLGKLARIIG